MTAVRFIGYILQMWAVFAVAILILIAIGYLL